MTLPRTHAFSQTAEKAGIHSLASAGLLNQSELIRLVQSEASSLSAAEVYADAQRAHKDALILEKGILTRASPLLPKAIKLGLRQPGASLRDYEEWFGDRAAQYANPGDVASMFSPAAYLTALYREVRTFYPADSQWHIDQRRPDLAGLALSQNNMDAEVSALELSIEIMLTKVRDSLPADSHRDMSADDAVLKMLSTDVRSIGTPYHHHHARLRQVCALKDPGFTQLAAAPAVTRHLSESSLAAIYYDIPPALYHLLTDEITEQNAQEKFTTYFGDLPPQVFLDPVMLRSWYGLSDKELRAFIGDTLSGGGTEQSYTDNMLITWVGDRVYRLSYIKIREPKFGSAEIYPQADGSWQIKINHQLTEISETRKFNEMILYIDNVSKTTIYSKDFGDNVFVLGKEYVCTLKKEDIQAKKFELKTVFWFGDKGSGYNFDYSLEDSYSYNFLLKLNKAIRLSQATGLAPRVLEAVVNSSDPEHITDETFSLLFRTGLLMKQYAISHQDAEVMARSMLTLTENDGERSQFTRLFNSPPLVEGGFQTNDSKTIDLSPEQHDSDPEIKATLKRAYQTDAAGLADLGYCLDSAAAVPQLTLTLVNLSRLHTLSLWARLHGLSPAELRLLLTLSGLPTTLATADVAVWNLLLSKLQATTRWLSACGFGVQDLSLMTRSIDGIPASAEIVNFLMQLQASVASSAGAVALPQKISLLAPLMAATFNLGSDVAVQALLRWVHQARPGGIDLDALWAALSPAEEETEARSFSAAVVAFAYGLAQRALIIHASGIGADALALFVDKPATLDSSLSPAAALPCSLAAIMALSTAAGWLNTLADSAGAGGALMRALNTTGVDAQLLAQATGLSEAVTAQAISAAQTFDSPALAGRLASYSEIDVVLQWMRLAAAFGVMPDDIGGMLALNYGTAAGTGTDDDWASWQRVAHAFSAGLTPSQTAASEAALAPGLAAALSGWLTSMQSSGAVASSREALHRMLLIDSLNGPQVKTSRLAAAVESLQSVIHRTLTEPEGGNFNTDALSGSFMRDWTQWNSRYSTWAAAQKLRYYPENYIDPTVRLGQTQMMDEMLQVLGQAQINTDTVGDAFMGYLNGFEAVANLETVSGYYDARYDSNATSKGKTWFIGRSESEPREYWWRTLDGQKRSVDGKLPANAWSGWIQITCSPQPYGELIRPVVYKKRLYLGWVERQKHVTQRGEDGKEKAWEYIWTLKMAWLRYDGNWSTPASYPLIAKDVTALEMVTPENLSLYLSAWPEQQYMMASLYDRSEDFRAGQEIVNWGAMRIFEDMQAEPHTSMAADLITILSQLDTTLRRGVCAVYFGVAPIADTTLGVLGTRPGRFTQFDGAISNVSLITESNGNSDILQDNYRLNFSARLEVTIPNDYRALNYLIAWFGGSSGKWSSYIGRNGDDFVISVFDYSSSDLCKIYFLLDDSKYPRTTLSTFFRFTDENGKIIDIGSSVTGSGANYTLSVFQKMPKQSFDIKKFHSLVIRDFDGIKPDIILTRADFGITDPNDIFYCYEKDAPFNIVFPADEVTCKITGPKGGVTTIPYKGADITADSTTGSTITFPLTTAPGDELFYSIADWGTGKTEFKHRITFQCGKGYTRDYTLRVYKQGDELGADLIVSHKEGAQYLQHGGYRTRLNTLFARQLTERAASGIDRILSYDTQQLPEPPTGEGAYLTVTLPAWDKDKHSSREAVIHLDDFLFWSGNLATQPQTITLFAPFNWREINGIRSPEPALNYYHIWLTFNGQKTQPAHVVYSKRDKDFVVLGVSLSTKSKPGKEAALVTDPMPDGVFMSADWKRTEPMDFSGANALYFWELFYYTPMMVMQRFLQEARFDQAESWLKYVFNPAGYLIGGNHTARMWNVRPLNEDTSWNSEPLESWDPDAVAQNDPMHYKLNAFMRLLDIIIGRGDAAYRKLERDTLAEAKVWYDRALSLLGEAPWIAPNAGWTSPVLGTMAEDEVQHARFDALSDLAQGRRAAPERPAQATEGSTVFYPEANDRMLGYWDTLSLRLYNLRHNLTLDGQPLNLALWATPADPKALLASAVASENGSGGGLPVVNDIPSLRFMPLLDSARGMAGQLIQFGSSLLQVLERQDGEALAELLLAQGSEMADSSLSLQKQQLNELVAERTTLTHSLASATLRRNHYNVLYEENINRRETAAMDLLTSAQMIGTGAQTLYVAAGVAAVAPNIFGLANGGMNYAGPLSAAAIGVTIAADATSAAGQRLSQEEMYRRRREEWDIQRKMAEGDMAVIQAQLDALTVRETSAGMQIKQMETQLAHAQAQLTLLQGKFTGKAMYSWLRSRLSTIFFQFYDLTASRCLMAQKALQWEKNDSAAYLRTGTWSGNWAGLTSGEGLMLALAQMEDAWLRWQKREKEVTRTVSLNGFFTGRLNSDDRTSLSLADAVRQLLAGGTSASLGEGGNKVELNDGKLAIHFDLADMAINEDGLGAVNAHRRVRTIAVTLPTLLGPYQNVRAVLSTNNTGLPPGCHECVISHAQVDNGLLNTDGADPRWLPFEGLPLTSTDGQPVENGMTLSFADATGDQKTLLENLSDVIIHIQYSLR